MEGINDMTLDEMLWGKPKKKPKDASESNGEKPKETKDFFDEISEELGL